MALRGIGVALSLAPLLMGCAAQRIVVGDTRGFVAAGRNAGTEASAFFERARQRQIEANVLLVASDPSCEWGPAIYLRQDFTTGSSLCVSGPAAQRAIRYPLRPAGAAVSTASAETLAALAAYVGELAALTAPGEPQFAQAVQDVEGRLKTLQGALDGAAKLDVGAFAAASATLQAATARYKAPVDAVAGMLDYFAELDRTARQAGDVRAVIARRGVEVEDGIEALAVTVDALGIGVVGPAGQVAQDALITGTNRQLSRVADFDKRRQVLTQLVISLEEQRRIDAGMAATAKLLRDLKTQHAALRRFAAGQYDKEARERIRRDQANQTWDLIGRIGGLAGAIGGVL